MAKRNLMDDAATVSFDEFLPYVAVEVDGVPAEVIGHATRLAAIEFAQRTRILRRRLTLSTQRGVQMYALDHTDHYTILQMDSVHLCDQPLRPRDNHDAPGGDWFEFDMPGGLYLGPTIEHDSLRDLEIRAIVSPGQDSCQVDKVLYDLYAEPIAKGALQRVLSMSSETWFNPTLAVFVGRQFTAGIMRARALEQGRYATAPQTISMPRGFFV